MFSVIQVILNYPHDLKVLSWGNWTCSSVQLFMLKVRLVRVVRQHILTTRSQITRSHNHPLQEKNSTVSTDTHTHQLLHHVAMRKKAEEVGGGRATASVEILSPWRCHGFTSAEKLLTEVWTPCTIAPDTAATFVLAVIKCSRTWAWYCTGQSTLNKWD